MRNSLIALTAIGIAITTANGASDQSTSAEMAVRQADSAWAAAMGTNNVDRVLLFYDTDAVFVGTNPPAAGLEQIRALWSRFFARPGYKLTWKADRVEVASSGDMAYSYGQWEQTVLQNDQPRTTRGICVAVWRKQQDGSWKVLVDKP